MNKLINTLVLGIALIISANPIFAESLSINFEAPTYSLGNINLQNGWSKSGAYDANVSNNSYGLVNFGNQALRLSNAITSEAFGDQTFSKSLNNEAGETTAHNDGISGGTRQNQFEAEFDLTTITQNLQPGLSISVSPDRGDGARMSYLRFKDNLMGIDVFFNDYQDIAPVGEVIGDATKGCGLGDDFVETKIATLSRLGSHKFKIVMDFVDGPRNDVVKIYIDNNLVKIGTSWEDYFRYCEGNETRTVDSLLFRAGGIAAPQTFGHGFLIDNLTLSSGILHAFNTLTHKDECKNNGWMSMNSPSFKNPGDCVSYLQSNPKAKDNPIN